VNQAQRQIRIRALLEDASRDLETLCRELSASESSVRRDLVRLEQAQVIKRVHGGAMAVQPHGHLLDYNWQRERQSDEKHRIGLRAASLIADDETVILDGGSTVDAVAEHLANRSLRVITNSLAIVRLFHDSRNIDVTLTGGFLFPRLETVLGPLCCEHMLAAVAAGALVMGIGGVTADGFSNNNTLVVGSERKMIEVSRTVIIVADSSKFGRAAMTAALLEIADTVVPTSICVRAPELLVRADRRVLPAATPIPGYKRANLTY
jgi:DeoR/GlpR family transcriptional regulator of sugar metabolism